MISIISWKTQRKAFLQNHKSKIQNLKIKTRFETILLCLLLILFGNFVYAQGVLEKRVKTLFSYLEDEKASSSDKQKLIEQIIELGSSASPLVQERFQSTGNPSYWYILEKLKKSSLSDSKKIWSKEKYFYEKYQEALSLLEEEGAAHKAKRITQSILILEPDLSFNKKVKQLYHRANNFVQPLVQAIISPKKDFVPYGEEVALNIYLYNKAIEEILLQTQSSSIILKVIYRDYDLSSNIKTDTKTIFFPLDKEILLPPGKHWKAKLTVNNEKPKNIIYREIEISARIPVICLVRGEKKSYPRLIFPSTKVKVFPAPYQQRLDNSSSHFYSAIRFSDLPSVFFYSFFVPPKKQKDAIHKIIPVLGRDPQLTPILYGILRRWTKKNFQQHENWKNWWLAEKNVFQPENLRKK